MKRVHTIGLAIGLALLAWLIYKSGPATLLSYLRRIGWGMLVLLAIAAARNASRALALRLGTGPESGRFSFPAVYTVMLVSEAIKFAAFAGIVLGESAKASLLRRSVSGTRAASSVVLDVLLFNLAGTLFILTGAALLFARLDLPEAVRRAGAIAGVALAAGVLLAVVAFARRMITAARLLDWLAHRACWRAWAESHRAKLFEADEHIFSFYRAHTTAFWGMLALGYISHLIAAAEIFAIARMLAVPLRLPDTLAVESLRKLASVIGLMAPANVGFYEGATALGVRALGLTVAAGVAIEFTRKIRAILWAAIGFLPLLSPRLRARLI